MLSTTDVIQSEKGLRDLIGRNLRKEIHPGPSRRSTSSRRSSTTHIASGITYDVTDLRAGHHRVRQQQHEPASAVSEDRAEDEVQVWTQSINDDSAFRAVRLTEIQGRSPGLLRRRGISQPLRQSAGSTRVRRMSFG